MFIFLAMTSPALADAPAYEAEPIPDPATQAELDEAYSHPHGGMDLTALQEAMSAAAGSASSAAGSAESARRSAAAAAKSAKDAAASAKEVAEAIAAAEQAPEPTVTIEEIDTDGDGIVNSEDACPDVAEDFAGDDDWDGCPEVIEPTEPEVIVEPEPEPREEPIVGPRAGAFLGAGSGLDVHLAEIYTEDGTVASSYFTIPVNLVGGYIYEDRGDGTKKGASYELMLRAGFLPMNAGHTLGLNGFVLVTKANGGSFGPGIGIVHHAYGSLVGNGFEAYDVGVEGVLQWHKPLGEKGFGMTFQLSLEVGKTFNAIDSTVSAVPSFQVVFDRRWMGKSLVTK